MLYNLVIIYVHVAGEHDVERGYIMHPSLPGKGSGVLSNEIPTIHSVIRPRQLVFRMLNTQCTAYFPVQVYDL